MKIAEVKDPCVADHCNTCPKNTDCKIKTFDGSCDPVVCERCYNRCPNGHRKRNVKKVFG